MKEEMNALEKEKRKNHGRLFLSLETRNQCDVDEFTL